MAYDKIMRYILTFEAIVLNAGTGAICLAAPNFFVSQFSTDTMSPVALEFIRWYGVLLWVLAFYVLRILPMKDDRILAPAVEALLFGDLVHLFYPFNMGLQISPAKVIGCCHSQTPFQVDITL